MRLGIVTGLLSEAKIAQEAIRQSAGQADASVRCAGANSSRARLHAEALIESGAEALLSFGVAGALDPELSPGALIVPRGVRGLVAGEVSCDMVWQRTLVSLLEPHQRVHVGDMAHSETLVASAEEKQALHEHIGAAAVDMESGAVAEASSAAGIPFLIVRAIADPAGRAPPAAALDVVAPDGSIRYGASVAAFVGRPSLIPIFLRLGRDNRAALETLRRVALLGAPLFGMV